MFYVYILQSENNSRLYIGKTVNLRRLFQEHNAGQNVSTKAYRPWTIIFYESYIKSSDTNRREKYLKTTQGHQTIKRMLRVYFQESSDKHFDYQGSTA
jgi:putative endonuclease